MNSQPDDIVLLSHGGGGARMKQLIDDLLRPLLANEILNQMDDAACISLPSSEIVFTTDSYVVSPFFFPGGDIGRLAVCGTCNDLAMQCGEPLFLSLGLILEEGLAIADLRSVIESISEATHEANVRIATGDTKVVERGKGAGIFINTSGIGMRRFSADGSVARAKEGDAVIVSGTLGDHGIAVMSQREGLRFETEILSDAAPLWDMIRPLLEAGLELHCLRDPTRGGLTAALCDIAEASKTGINISEAAVPVHPAVQAAAALLGLDPLHIANEGKAVIILPADQTERALELLRGHPLGRNAAIIGSVGGDHPSTVLLETRIGGRRVLGRPAGEDLPRIC